MTSSKTGRQKAGRVCTPPSPLPVMPRTDLEPVCVRFKAMMHQLRTDAHLSFHAMEPLTGLSRRTLAKIEQGQEAPTLDSVSRIAHALGFEPELLLLMAQKGIRLPPSQSDSEGGSIVP